ncbi:MAG: cytochrome c [Deltaproteobacteria bacterium]|nr:cytochrome c [Deltaproteobacteria bacterium]MDE0343413.1 cytochrome c [Deltaproteobacteria bacterium]
MRRLVLTLAVCAALTMTSACGKDEGTQTVTGPDPARGRRMYIATCIVCHNIDPSKPGSQGPAVKGSSVELLEAKVLRKTYPPGYKPQRTTSAMPTYPQVRKRIPDIAAFLAQP